MMQRAILSVFRPLKRVVMWFTGQPELQARVGRLEQLIAEMATQQQARDVALSGLAAQQQARDVALSGLAARQDEAIVIGHRLSEKLDLMLASLTQLPQLLKQAGSETIANEIDRMDGYLVYQAGEVRAEIDRVRSAVLGELNALRRRLEAAASG
jgi:hypothetical protein